MLEIVIYYSAIFEFLQEVSNGEVLAKIKLNYYFKQEIESAL